MVSNSKRYDHRSVVPLGGGSQTNLIAYVRSLFASSYSELKIFRVSLPRLNFGRLPPTILLCARCGQSLKFEPATEEITCRRRLPSTTKRLQSTLRVPRITTGRPPSIMRRETTKRRHTML